MTNVECRNCVDLKAQDFLALLERMQSQRLDDQRCEMPDIHTRQCDLRCLLAVLRFNLKCAHNNADCKRRTSAQQYSQQSSLYATFVAVVSSKLQYELCMCRGAHQRSNSSQLYTC
ncbi:hypothetical protein Tcan_17679 [Toxocara canis]|uniref:Uncharacterized protein n=1 Tax=Toxocara canis TaxID=6265 RepID=A0A0B2V2H0_TOXCA|nr:hypothetical protein Tcan_17679 [Toxocara canis]